MATAQSAGRAQLLVVLLAAVFVVGCPSRPSESAPPTGESPAALRAPQAAAPTPSALLVEDCVATAKTSASVPTGDLPASAIVLHPGDTVCLVKGVEGMWAAAPRAAAQAPHLMMWVTFENGTTMLAARNGTHGALRYRAAMRVPGNRSWEETSIAEVPAGLAGFETWQQPMEALAVFAIVTAHQR